MSVSVELPAAPPARRRGVIPAARILLFASLVVGIAIGGWLTHETWWPRTETATAIDDRDRVEEAAPSEQIELSAQAQKNLKMVAKPLKAETFVRTVSIPGMVIDRPGTSDRSVVSPVAGVVSRIHRFAGDRVGTGETLFTIRLLSETIQQTQTDLFRNTQDIELADAQKRRLTATPGVVSESRLIEIDSQLARLKISGRAWRQELLVRGFSPEQIGAIGEGRFVTEVVVKTPEVAPQKSPPVAPMAFEIQELKIELGQQVLAGQTLVLLANHQLLSLEGQAFRDEIPMLEKAIRDDVALRVDFAEGASSDWPSKPLDLRIAFMANTIDPVTRTFRFSIPLENQSRDIDRDGRIRTLWQYRPGQRVRILLPGETFDNVFVLPVDAVVREGPQAFVFRQNVDTFERKAVVVLYRDRDSAVVANDGSVLPGMYIARTGAAQLQRMIRSQTGAVPKGFHVHADGSVHGAH